MTVAVVLVLCTCILAEAAAAGSLQRKPIAIVDGTTVATKPGSPSNYANRYANYAAGGRHNAGGSSSSSTTSAVSPATSKICKPGSVLRVDYSPAPQGDGRIYGTVFGSGIHLVGKEDYFEYEIMWKESTCNCSVEFEMGTTYRLRDDGPLDEAGYSPHAEKNCNMSAVAFGKWYKRSWRLSSDLEGRYIDKFVFSAFIVPGTTATAFFKYIRVVRKHGEGKKIIFEEGHEPMSVNTYFPGTITTSCQHVTLVEATDVSFVREGSARLPGQGGDWDVSARWWSLEPGKTAILRGQITTRDLDDVAAPDHHREGQIDTCSWGSPLDQFRQLRRAQATHVNLMKVVVNLRHGLYSDVTLMPLWSFHHNHSSPIFQHPPLPFFAVASIPPWNIMTHLLNSSVIDISVTYMLRQPNGGEGATSVNSDPIEMKVFTKVVLLAEHDGSASPT